MYCGCFCFSGPAICRCDEVGSDGGGSGGGTVGSSGGGRDGRSSDGGSGGGSGDGSARESEPQRSATSSILTAANQGSVDSSRLLRQSQQEARQRGEQAGGVVCLQSSTCATQSRMWVVLSWTCVYYFITCSCTTDESHVYGLD